MTAKIRPNLHFYRSIRKISPKAVRYQIAIVFAIAAATALGTMSVILLAFLALFSPLHQLRLDWLARQPNRS